MKLLINFSFIIAILILNSCTKKHNFKDGQCLMSPDGAVFKITEFKRGELTGFSPKIWDRKDKIFKNFSSYKDFNSHFANHFEIECPDG